MRTYLAGLLALAALATLCVSSVEARGRRCGGGSCGVFQGRLFHGGHVFGNHCGTGGCNVAGHVHTSQCGPNGCIVQGTLMPRIEEGTTSPRSTPTQAIQVRDSQGRIYYLVPQSQYEQK